MAAKWAGKMAVYGDNSMVGWMADCWAKMMHTARVGLRAGQTDAKRAVKTAGWTTVSWTEQRFDEWRLLGSEDSYNEDWINGWADRYDDG